MQDLFNRMYVEPSILLTFLKQFIQHIYHFFMIVYETSHFDPIQYCQGVQNSFLDVKVPGYGAKNQAADAYWVGQNSHDLHGSKFHFLVAPNKTDCKFSNVISLYIALAGGRPSGDKSMDFRQLSGDFF